MTIEAHIDSISQKRASLKQRIAEEMSHPSPNFALIRQLKQQNLALKEETQRCFRRMRSSASA